MSTPNAAMTDIFEGFMSSQGQIQFSLNKKNRKILKHTIYVSQNDIK